MSQGATGCLVGVRVLDIGQLIAAPVAAALLADHGADVVKVERPGVGDPLRRLAPHRDGVPLWWKVNGRNKRCIALDLKDAVDRDTFLALVRQADVVVENFVPGYLDAIGLDYEVLKQVNPRIVLLRISGFGQDGPYRSRKAFGRTAEAFSGMTYITGHPDGPPLHSGFPIADYIAGVLGAFSVMAALHERDQRSGEGQQIDLALFEAPFRLMEFAVTAFDQLGVVTERLGNENSYVAPVGTWKSADGHWLSLTASTQEMTERLFAAMGAAELADDDRLRTNAARVDNRRFVNDLVATWIGSLPADEALARLWAADVAVTPVMSVADIVEDEHYRARQAIVEVDDDELGCMRMQGVVPRFSRTPGAVRTAGRRLDQDRDDVLADWLDAYH